MLLVAGVAVALGLAQVLRVTYFAEQPVPVQVHAVERGQVEATVTNSKAGTIEARRRAKLSTGTGGIVVDLPARRGFRVESGELLLRLDDRTQRATVALETRAVEVAEAVHARTCLAEQRALRGLERNRKLAEAKIVSTDVLDELESAHELAVAQCAVAAAEVEHRRAALMVAEAELEKTRLIAPFDAMVAEVAVEVGEWVTPSVALVAAPDVIDAIDTSSLYVSAPMDEVDAALLAVGQPARVTIDSFPDRSFEGKVVRVAPYVEDFEQQNRTLEIEVELSDQDFSSTLLAGTSADVEVILSVRQNVLRVPSYCLIEGGRVLVLEGDRLVERELELGLRNWDWTEVEAGLEPGERVVTTLDRARTEAGAKARVEDAGRRP